MRIGDLILHPVSDGTFIARPEYFGRHLWPGAHPEFFSRGHAAWLPIGCFLVRAGDRLVLIDAGLGPDVLQLPHGMHLAGGQLLTGLRGPGVTAGDVTDVVCSHFHADHVGWLFGPDAKPVFPQAAIWFGSADWHHFVARGHDMRTHIREGFRAAADSARLQPIDQDTTITAGITALLAQVAGRVSRCEQRGDAVTCPIQLDEPTWHSMGDVDSAWPTAPENACGVNWKMSTPPAPERTSPNSNSVGSHRNHPAAMANLSARRGNQPRTAALRW